ncbi:acylphosphatase [Sneathiella sp. P13V-1]|uniref:acylphosphatase n=1 Tax=Sneathiella sp. P13V-1 TaxID=2697366 RepID=UPI00187B53A0|nr:acylphosphatase [Sneathiella sp. P13V-1]MBE7636788.1 acylphosphatase [Sneathiella sp. P13V-1]
MPTVHVRITGRVQGVGYRAWTVEHASRAGLTGWVRNRSDGSVEAVLQGSETTIEAFLARCQEGPRFAKVYSVTTESIEKSEIFSDFTHKTTL